MIILSLENGLLCHFHMIRNKGIHAGMLHREMNILVLLPFTVFYLLRSSSFQLLSVDLLD